MTTNKTLLGLFAIVVSLFNGQPSPFVQGMVDGMNSEMRGGLFVKNNYEGYHDSTVDKYLKKMKGSKGRYSKSKGHKGKKHDKKKAKHHNGKQHGKKHHKKSTKHSYTPAPTPLETIIVPDYTPAPTPLETILVPDRHLRNDNTNQMGTDDDIFSK
eukprot:CAMPEP_0172422006 /NCGR_PEP_ID=MMETSP1064-20121228/8207_1 /TAXON_ID=202472 /ORGANISM="Aulacoseira subarctica , Strain CCAP 1002/5" /LENGTH=155 /DNA_ID=CAMNT_0013162659 /DNA_START=251 /DNA_END=718 /DNA_ORIENTATION=+